LLDPIFGHKETIGIFFSTCTNDLNFIWSCYDVMYILDFSTSCHISLALKRVKRLKNTKLAHH